MRVIFFGTDGFAAEILETLLKEGVHIVALVTQPDRPQGRKLVLTPPPVKVKMQSLIEGGIAAIPIYQPEKASHPDSVEQLRAHKPDLLIVISYGQILRQSVLDLPTLMAINVHPSLLPKYRGASPIQSALLTGERETGVTIMEMILAMDAGDILKQVKVVIPEEMHYGQLEKTLCEAAKQPLLEVIQEFSAGRTIYKKPQDPLFVTYTKKILSEDCFIDWSKPGRDIVNLVRAVDPTPGARIWIDDNGVKKLIKIFRIRYLEGLLEEIPLGKLARPPGGCAAFSKTEGWQIFCADGIIQILELQPQSGRRMQIEEFVCGFSGEKKYPQIMM